MNNNIFIFHITSRFIPNFGMFFVHFAQACCEAIAAWKSDYAIAENLWNDIHSDQGNQGLFNCAVAKPYACSLILYGD